MFFRDFQPEDADIVASWVKDEKAMYQWSAFWISEYPFTGEKLNEVLDLMREQTKLFPLLFCEDDGTPRGFLFLRYLDEAEKKARFGFIIVDPEIRGKGYGKRMLLQAERYAIQDLDASEISLGVFENNPQAYYAYRAAGFRETGEVEACELKIGTWNCIEMRWEGSPTENKI